VRDLKDHISQVLDEVREKGEPVEVTKHGRSVARIVPISADERNADRDINGAWTALNKLAERIRAQWPEGVSAEDVLNDVRG
jgi:prevent-host-death family protein